MIRPGGGGRVVVLVTMVPLCAPRTCCPTLRCPRLCYPHPTAPSAAVHSPPPHPPLLPHTPTCPHPRYPHPTPAPAPTPPLCLFVPCLLPFTFLPSPFYTHTPMVCAICLAKTDSGTGPDPLSLSLYLSHSLSLPSLISSLSPDRQWHGEEEEEEGTDRAGAGCAWCRQ